MTTEVIEGNVEAPVDNVVPEVEATSPAVEAEAADPEIAEAERLLEAEAAVAPQPGSRSLDDFTEDEFASHPVVNGLRRRWEMSAAQKEAEKVKRQSGNDEAVRQYALRLKDIAESGDAEQYQSAITSALALNRAYQEDQVVEFFTNGVKDAYKVSPESYEKAVTALQQGDRAGYVTNMIDGAVTAKTASLKLSDIPEGSPLRAEIDAEAKSRAARIIAAELKAAKAQAAPKLETPPSAPSGGPAGAGQSISTISEADAAYSAGRISFSEYRQYRVQFGLSTDPGGR